MTYLALRILFCDRYYFGVCFENIVVKTNSCKRLKNIGVPYKRIYSEAKSCKIKFVINFIKMATKNPKIKATLFKPTILPEISMGENYLTILGVAEVKKPIIIPCKNLPKISIFTFGTIVNIPAIKAIQLKITKY